MKTNIIETIQTLLDIRNVTGLETATSEQIEFLMEFKNLIPNWFKEAYEKDSWNLKVWLENGGDYFDQLANSSQIMNPNNFMQLQFLSTLYVVVQETVDQTENGCQLDDVINIPRSSHQQILAKILFIKCAKIAQNVPILSKVKVHRT